MSEATQQADEQPTDCPDFIYERELAAIRAMRDRGFCVVVWCPTEIGDCDIDHLEEIAIERGNMFLEQNRPDEDEEQD